MKKIIAFLTLIFVGLFMVRPCFSKTVKIDADSPSNIFVKQNQNIALQFAGNPTTGYRWKVEILPEKTNVIELTEGIYVPRKHKKKTVGYGGVYKFNLKAVNKGEAQIKCIYSRSWEKKPFKEIIYDIYVE